MGKPIWGNGNLKNKYFRNKITNKPEGFGKEVTADPLIVENCLYSRSKEYGVGIRKFFGLNH